VPRRSTNDPRRLGRESRGPAEISLRLVAAGAALLSALAVADAAQERSTNDAVFTAAQAARGRAIFEGRCTQCHETSRFQGGLFLESWAGQPLGALFDVVRTTMPEDAPGSLPPQQYADVIAYFLKLNGFPEGEVELEANERAMRSVKLEAPAAAGTAR
jgi:mono/diheme cytochrome c family protein